MRPTYWMFLSVGVTTVPCKGSVVLAQMPADIRDVIVNSSILRFMAQSYEINLNSYFFFSYFFVPLQSKDIINNDGRRF
jgi:hypothetical protein